MPALPWLLAAAGAACTAGSEFEPPLCPTRLPAVAAVRIERQGVTRWRDPQAGPPCRTFRLTDAQVRGFLKGARQADARAVHFTLPESPCVVQGRIRFADGTSGRWSVDRSAVGWLDRPGHPRMTLYCRGCRRRPWIQ